MKVGDLVRFVDVFGNDERVALILVVDVDMAKTTTFGWVNKTLLEVISESR